MSKNFYPCKPSGVQACKIIEEKLRKKDPRYWTQYRIAKEIGMSQTAYRALRNDTRHPSTATAKKLFAFAERELGMSLSSFWDLL